MFLGIGNIFLKGYTKLFKGYRDFSKVIEMFFKGYTEGVRMIYTIYQFFSIPPHKC